MVALTQQEPDEAASSSSQDGKQAFPALVAGIVATLLLVNGLLVGGLLVLEVAFMSACSRDVLRFFWGLVWTIVLAGYFYYWVIFIA